MRPVANSTDALEVKHGIALQKIEEVDTYSNVLKVNLWENYVSKKIDEVDTAESLFVLKFKSKWHFPTEIINS